MGKKSLQNKTYQSASKNKSKRYNTGISFVLVLLLLGVACMFVGGYNLIREQPTTPPTIIKPVNTMPASLSIPSVTISLPVFPTAIANNTWEINKDGASYLQLSARPGTKGTLIIYAHNTLNRFGRLPQIKKEDLIMITDADGKTYTYTVVGTQIVSARNVAILASGKEEKLVLYTCYGFADLKRFVVFAKRINSNSSQS